jgi:hypothetical protein
MIIGPSTYITGTCITFLGNTCSALPGIHRLLNPGEYTVFNAKESAPVDYEVEVATSDRFNAGTSAHPFVNIFGLQGSTGEPGEEGPWYDHISGRHGVLSFNPFSPKP